MVDGHISEPPSRRSVLLMMGCATLVAGALLTCVILPAEYAIDPLGTGKALGLTAMTSVNPSKRASRPDVIAGASINPVLLSARDTSRWGESAVVQGAYIAQQQRLNVDSREVVLEPGEGMEIKYHMSRGGGLVYSWTATAPVLFDFHAEPDVKPTGEDPGSYSESYARDDTRGTDQFNGTLIAPSAGIQGWYWENTTPGAIRIRLVASGFFDWIYQNRNEQTTRLRPTDSNVLPSHPAIPDRPL
jgi:hypothetical protein